MGWMIVIAVWEICAVLYGNALILPGVVTTFSQLKEIFTNRIAINAISHTLTRIFIALSLSYIAALVSAFLMVKNKFFHMILSPVYTLTKTIPNISYMILALVWLSTEGAGYFIVMMVVYPLCLSNFLNAFENETESQKEIAKLYKETFLSTVLYHDLPLLKFTLLQTAQTAGSFALKIGVMAEILTAVRNGIGREMRIAQINLETGKIFAWTIVMIVLSLVYEWGFRALIRCLSAKEKQTQQ